MRGSGVWRAVLVVAFVFAAVWACVIAWWRLGGASPDAGRMLLWLLLVPVALLAAIWMGARLRRRRAQAPAAAGETDLPSNAGEPDEASAGLQPLAILAASAHLACGSDVRSLAGGLADLPRPGLHPALRDRDGLPVLAAFKPDLDTASVEAGPGRAGGPRPPPEHLRALALLEPVALELFESAARLLPPVPEAEERVIAGLRRSVDTSPGDHGSVDVVALLPRDFPPALRQACDGWLRELAAECGLDARRSHLQVLAGDDADGTWRRIAGLLAGEDIDSTRWQLLLATGSAIGERGLHALAAAGPVASGRHAEGVLPGEGAAGLLLRPPAAVQPAGEDPGCEIAALRTGTFDAAAPARRAARDTAALLAEVMQSGCTLRDDVAMVVSDADQRASRSVEAAVAASAACPDLDPVAAFPAIGVASGHLGHVAPLALLALAAARVEQDGSPVMTLSVASASRRTAAVLRRPAEAAAHQDSTATEPDAAAGVAA